MANDVAATTGSLPLVVYEFLLTAITNVNGTTANSISIGPLPESYTKFNGMLLQVITQTTGTAAAGYATYNQDTATLVPSTGTVDNHLTVDIYVFAAAGTAAIVKILLY
jgi:hypothetical protein